MASETDLILHVLERRTGDALDGGARDLDRVASSADDADGSFRNLAQGTGFVDTEIVRLRGHIRELGAEIDRTGNTSLFKDMRADQSSLRKFENLAKMLRPVGEEGGKSFNRGFLASLGGLGGNLRGALIPAAIGLGAVLSPLIGAAVAGAVVGGVGIGGIAGGIAMASQDNAVRQSARLFGDDISREFFADGQTFVAPIIESLDILRDSFRGLDFGEALAPLAGVLPTLAEGLAGFASSAMPGLAQAFQAAVPAIELLSQMLPELGESFGDMFATIAESEGTMTGLRTLLAAINMTMQVTAFTIDFLATAFDQFVRGMAAVTGAMEDLLVFAPVFRLLNDGLEGLAGIGPKVDGAWAPIPGRFNAMASSTENARQAAEHLSMSIDGLRDALDKLFDDQMNYDQALLAVKKDTLALKKAVDDHGTSLSNNTEAGLANQGMILDLVTSYERERDAAIRAGKGTAEATQKFDSQVAALGRMLSKLGFTRSQIDSLLGAYKRLHSAPNIQKEIRINVVTSGQTGALSLIGAGARVATFDTGGWVQGPPGKPQVAIVHGGEFVLSREMLKGAAAPQRTPMPAATGGVGPVTVNLVVRTSGAPLDDLVGDLVRRYVYTKAGGDPVRALSSGR